MGAHVSDLPEQYAFLKPFVFAASKQPAGLRGIEVVRAAGVCEDDDAWSVVANFVLTRRTEADPQAWAQAWASEHPEASGMVAVTYLTPLSQGYRSRPVMTKRYRVSAGKASRQALRESRTGAEYAKRGLRLVASIDLRQVQQARADEPIVIEFGEVGA